ncbi:MAG: hypothetical protein N2690_08005, partial [Rhodocyclaceae bacterium]|nr:hypothetical protein [Rhodocyclaceae bacterium]
LGARFERDPPAPPPAAAGEPDYAVLPAPTLAALREAAAGLDSERVRQIAGEIATRYPELGRHIAEQAGLYRFDRIEALCGPLASEP